jgi:hypothetical protein
MILAQIQERNVLKIRPPLSPNCNELHNATKLGRFVQLICKLFEEKRLQQKFS